jgi:ribonuclease P/MRP protein subunit RPP40
MLDFDDDASRREKCFTTIAQLPAFVDPKQPPTKKSPFSAIVNHPFVHTVEVILPEEVYSSVKDPLDAKVQKLRYARVFMSPSALLEGDFFNTYIKTGNILMISEGRSGSDNVYTLKDGILKLEIGKEVYERTGLTGKPIRSGGRKHAKERYRTSDPSSSHAHSETNEMNH